MKTIKELKAMRNIKHIDWTNIDNVYRIINAPIVIETLKDVLGLMKKLEMKKEIAYIWDELKSRIEG